MKTIRHYILNKKGQPLPEPSLLRWARWFEECREEQIVKQEQVGEHRVSTVFLGLDHNWTRRGGPVLWETMVFGGVMAGLTERCSGNREQAEAMHERVCYRVRYRRTRKERIK